MKISTVTLNNFRAFKASPPIRLGPLTTIVGRNDAGKSTIVHALDIFFNGSPDLDDFNRDAAEDEPIDITVTFSELPDVIQLEDGVDTSLNDENLLDQNGELVVKKTYFRKNLRKSSTSVLVHDYADDQFRNLCSRKEAEMNNLGKEYGLEFRKSGSGITNKGKREALRRKADSMGLPKEPGFIEPSGDLEKRLFSILPGFYLFHTDWSLNEEDTPFQRVFKDLAAQRLETEAARDDIEGIVQGFIDQEVVTIHGLLLQHTDEVRSLKAHAQFKWKDLVSFRIDTTDVGGTDVPLAKRGAGLRRLVMVAYFQYLAQTASTGQVGRERVYAIEEPETYLHPSAQRVLLDSLLLISDRSQISLTSHSPVFAGSTRRDQLVLVTKRGSAAEISQGGALNLDRVADELGVHPSDSLYDYKACVFVEGPGDVTFLEAVAGKLKECGEVNCTFEDKGIGLIPLGGKDTLTWWVTRGALSKTKKKYGVLVDSDRQSASDTLPSALLGWQQYCQQDGGKFHITLKREIENYLHPAVLPKHPGIKASIGDFDDVKKAFGDNKIVRFVTKMSAQQILERDVYMDNGQERHELAEVIKDFMTLA